MPSGACIGWGRIDGTSVHPEARRAVEESDVLYVAVEAYSVDCPSASTATCPRRVELLRQHPDPGIVLGDAGYRALLDLVAGRPSSAAPVYDALVAAAARSRGATLGALDARAVGAYQAGAQHRPRYTR